MLGARSQIITFFKCNQLFLADCIKILNLQIVDLQLQTEIVIHDKCNVDQDGYNKVDIVTNLTREYAKGNLSNGVVNYPSL